jgi:tetratricopeptide (TPR) repeat protein
MKRRRTKTNKKDAKTPGSTSRRPSGGGTPPAEKARARAAVKAPEPSPARTGPWWVRYVWIIPVIQAFLLYSGIFDHQIVFWDDDLMLSRAWESPLSVETLVRTLTEIRDSYQPLRELSYAFDARVFGHDLRGVLLHNLLLYCLNVWVVFFILRRLFVFAPGFREGSPASGVQAQEQPDGEVPLPAPWTAALLACALFAAHPLHVESVTWLAARKEVLSGLFFFLSFLLFIQTPSASGRRLRLTYVGSLVAFCCALLSKPSAASLPLVILAYEVLLLRPPRSKWRRRALFHAPYWLPALAALLYFTLVAGTTETILAEQPIGTRLSALNLVVAHYFKTLFLPIHLTARYAFDWKLPFLSAPVLIGLGIQLILIASFFVSLKNNRLVSFLVAWFYINLLPTSGIIPISVQAADRYMYIPSLAFCFFIVWILFKVGGRLFRTSPRIAIGTAATAATTVILVFSFLTVKQNRIWENDLTLWTQTARYSPSDLSYYALAEAHRKRGDYTMAERCYRLSAQANPTFVRSWNGLGNMLLMRKDIRGAESAYLKALEQDPEYAHAHRHLAIVYVSLKDYDRALVHAEKAYQFGQRDAVLLDMLCRLYMNANDWEKLKETAERLMVRSGEKATAMIYLFRAYQGAGDLARARTYRKRAYEKDPEKARQAERTTIFRE